MTDRLAFQDESYIKNNHCWVCGNDNPDFILRVTGMVMRLYAIGNQKIIIPQVGLLS